MNVQSTFGKSVARQGFNLQSPIVNIRSCHSERSEESQVRDVRFAQHDRILVEYWAL